MQLYAVNNAGATDDERSIHTNIFEPLGLR